MPLTAEDAAIALASNNHSSVMPTTINFRAGGKPFKLYMFSNDLNKDTPLNCWQSLVKRLEPEFF